MIFVREKKYICGDYVEIDVVHYSTEQEQRLPRCKKSKVSSPAQMNLNDKNSKRYFRMLLNANFKEEDLHITPTYDEEHHPPDDETAVREVNNFKDRIKRLYQKAGIEFKCVIVTEYGHKNGRVHHHLIVNAGVDPKQIMKKWGKGIINVDYLQPDKKYGLAAIANYLTKDPQGGRHRWSGTRNLKKPIVQVNDNVYSLRAAAKVANDLREDMAGGLLRLQKRYKHYNISSAKVQANPITGMKEIYLMARRI